MSGSERNVKGRPCCPTLCQQDETQKIGRWEEGSSHLVVKHFCDACICVPLLLSTKETQAPCLPTCPQSLHVVIDPQVHVHRTPGSEERLNRQALHNLQGIVGFNNQQKVTGAVLSSQTSGHLLVPTPSTTFTWHDRHTYSKCD